MSLLKRIKEDVRNAGTNKSKFMYFRDGDKRRIRFLQDMDEGMEVVFHDSFEKGVNVPCQEQVFGKHCEFCEDDSLRTRSSYLWSVWDYEEKEIKLFMFPVNNYTPIPQLAAMYENYGTLVDRDYVISQTGKMQNKSFTVIPMDKNKFRNAKAKPYSEKTVKDLLNKAWPAVAHSNEEDEGFDEDDKSKYEDYSAKELYDMCIERDIEAEKRKIKAYYINLLLEDDKAEDDWGDDDDGFEDEDVVDEWEDEEDEWDE